MLTYLDPYICMFGQFLSISALECNEDTSRLDG